MTDKVYFIVNLTKQRNLPWPNKEFPTIKELGDFVSANDLLDLVRLDKTAYYYHGLEYDKSVLWSLQTEKINKKGDGFLSSKEKAQEWLEEKRNPKGVHTLPPRCEDCQEKAEGTDVQSVVDSGKCWTCRIPKRKNLVKKKEHEILSA